MSSHARIPAEDLMIGDTVLSCGCRLEVHATDRVSRRIVEVLVSIDGDPEPVRLRVLAQWPVTVTLPRPIDGAGIDRFDHTLVGAR